jgi:hypothetical protein
VLEATMQGPSQQLPASDISAALTKHQATTTSPAATGRIFTPSRAPGQGTDDISVTGHARADMLLIKPTGGPGRCRQPRRTGHKKGTPKRPDLVWVTSRSPAPSLVVLHPGAPQRHSQILVCAPCMPGPTVTQGESRTTTVRISLTVHQKASLLTDRRGRSFARRGLRVRVPSSPRSWLRTQAQVAIGVMIRSFFCAGRLAGRKERKGSGAVKGRSDTLSEVVGCVGVAVQGCRRLLVPHDSLYHVHRHTI